MNKTIPVNMTAIIRRLADWDVSANTAFWFFADELEVL